MKYESNLPSNRTCKKCGDEFLCSAAKIRKGHYICKPCSTVVSRSWANKNAARRAEKQKLYQSREETKRRKIEQFKRRRNDPVEGNKVRTREATRRLIKSGVIPKSPCAKCGAIKAEAHHHDYGKPNEIEWLCRKCHHRLHYPQAAMEDAGR